MLSGRWWLPPRAHAGLRRASPSCRRNRRATPAPAGAALRHRAARRQAAAERRPCSRSSTTTWDRWSRDRCTCLCTRAPPPPVASSSRSPHHSGNRSAGVEQLDLARQTVQGIADGSGCRGRPVARGVRHVARGTVRGAGRRCDLPRLVGWHQPQFEMRRVGVSEQRSDVLDRVVDIDGLALADHLGAVLVWEVVRRWNAALDLYGHGVLLIVGKKSYVCDITTAPRGASRSTASPRAARSCRSCAISAAWSRTSARRLVASVSLRHFSQTVVLVP